MVYCTKCGAKNPDDAKVCSQCGASLYPVRQERERYYRRYEEECFGIPRGGAIVGLAIGVIILLAGLLWLLQEANLIASNISVWPFAAIIFGILIVLGALFGTRRRY
jgi:uncharacterized membrane protein YvbJ